MRTERPLYEPLDECIDELLTTGAWTLHGESSDRPELAALMAVATQLVDLARCTPPPDDGKKRNLWRKLTTARAQLRRPGPLRLASLWRDAAGISSSNLARGGCRPLREVVP